MTITIAFSKPFRHITIIYYLLWCVWAVSGRVADNLERFIHSFLNLKQQVETKIHSMYCGIYSETAILVWKLYIWFWLSNAMAKSSFSIRRQWNDEIGLLACHPSRWQGKGRGTGHVKGQLQFILTWILLLFFWNKKFADVNNHITITPTHQTQS